MIFLRELCFAIYSSSCGMADLAFGYVFDCRIGADPRALLIFA